MRLFVSINSPNSQMASSEINEAITLMAVHAASESRLGHFPTGPALDITFMLSCINDAPPFTGMRMGRYKEEDNTLFFEAAVPEKMTQSTDAPRYVAFVLQDMVDNAKQYFDELCIAFDFNSWTRVIDKLIEAGLGKANAH